MVDNVSIWWRVWCKNVHVCSTTHHKSQQYLILVVPLLPMSSQYTISPAKLQSVHHLSCSCLLRIPPLLLMSNQHIISSVLVQSECHTYGHVQYEYHIAYPFPIWITYFLPMSSQYITSLPMSHHFSFPSSQYTTSPVHV